MTNPKYMCLRYQKSESRFLRCRMYSTILIWCTGSLLANFKETRELFYLTESTFTSLTTLFIWLMVSCPGIRLDSETSRFVWLTDLWVLATEVGLGQFLEWRRGLVRFRLPLVKLIWVSNFIRCNYQYIISHNMTLLDSLLM